ncbi:MAG: STAS/SEC14 domain-containing protein [Candidatus Magnetominusculus sp. LBB02]|nr:STAS/SEC14 domain-containing protein [Candidatus Magnetominusculus sp. LBB02]
MKGLAEVSLQDGIIIAVYTGEMSMEIVKQAAEDIEDLIIKAQSAKILYNTLEMESPSMKLAMEMKAFDAKIRDKIQKSATLVPGAATAFFASIAFILSKNHKIFHKDLDAALAWLKS